MNAIPTLSAAVLMSVALGQIVELPVIWFAPRTPSRPGTVSYQLPWQVHRQSGSGYGDMYDLDLPGYPSISALHRMDAPGRWLLSLERPSSLGGTTPYYLPRDVLLHDAGMETTSLFFCGAAAGVWLPIPLEPILPPGTNIDSLYLDPMTGGDGGDLVMGFDAPVELPPGSGTVHLPSDLVRFRRTGPGCGDWVFLGKEFDSTMAGGGIPLSTNIVAAAPHGESLLFVVDRPTVLTPSDLPDDTALPWRVVKWNGMIFSFFDVFTEIAGPSVQAGLTPPASASTSVSKAALSCGGNPGSVATGSDGLLQVTPSVASPGAIDLHWPVSCSAGALDYAVYEGTVSSWTSHVPKTCSTGGSTSATVTPGSGSRYYLIVPLGGGGEGSYGVRSDGTQRPPAAPALACAATQIVTACP